jgi:hypothetical protein
MKAVFMERMAKRKIEPGKTAEAWSAHQRAFYVSAGLNCTSSDVIQTGVLVLSQQHRAMLEKVYETDLDRSVAAYEQLPLSAAILNQGLFHRIDSRFNLVFVERMAVHYPYLLNKNLINYPAAALMAVMTEYSNSYFLHFAYDQSFMEFLDPKVYC